MRGDCVRAYSALSTVNIMTKGAPITASARRRDHLRAVGALDRHAAQMAGRWWSRCPLANGLFAHCLSAALRMAPNLRVEEHNHDGCSELRGVCS